MLQGAAGSNNETPNNVELPQPVPTSSTNILTSRIELPVTATENQLVNQSTPLQQPLPVSASIPSSSSIAAGSTPLSIHTYLQQQHRMVKHSHGDGNCLFRSLSFQLLGSEEEHIAVRTMAIRFENLNQGAFAPYLTAINKATMAEHIKHVQRPDVFGTHVEILAIATFLDVPTFYCCLSDRDQQYSWHCVEPLKQQGVRYPNLSGSPLEDVSPPTHFELSYVRNLHYDSITSTTGELCTEFPTLSTQEIYVDLSL